MPEIAGEFVIQRNSPTPEKLGPESLALRKTAISVDKSTTCASRCRKRVHFVPTFQGTPGIRKDTNGDTESKFTPHETRKGIVYQLDYRINGKRFRPKVGSDKHAAELTRKKVESDILYGTYELTSQNSKTISLDALIDEYLKSKKHHIRASSLKRYKNYFDRVSKFFAEFFPAARADIRLIETSYLREFIDNAIEAGASDGHAWSKRTVNDSIKIIRSLFGFAIENRSAETNPADKIAQLRIVGKPRSDRPRTVLGRPKSRTSRH